MFQAVMPMNASDFTLKVFGNANMDDTIDEKDIEYVEGIVNGKNGVTKLADADYNGKIDEMDIDQIKLIISGTEKELTFINCHEQNSTVHKPLNKIVAIHSSTIESLRILNKYNNIVGVDEWTFTNYPTLCSGLGAESVGAYADLDAETILKLKPDVLICSRTHDPNIESKLNGTGIDVVRLWLTKPETNLSELRTLSYILDEEENALDYKEWYDNVMDTILEKTSILSDDQKPNVLYYRFAGDSGKKTTCGGDTVYNGTLEIAGGKNIAVNLIDYPELDTEWALKQNPDVILGVSFSGGYEMENSNMLKERFEDIITTTGFDQLSAVKSGKVFVMYSALGSLCDKAYIAKWLHPDLFTDLDPVSIQQEYISKFLHLDFDIKAQGAFVYP
jgi:iron complex transport system substrate-binding protein